MREGKWRWYLLYSELDIIDIRRGKEGLWDMLARLPHFLQGDKLHFCADEGLRLPRPHFRFPFESASIGHFHTSQIVSGYGTYRWGGRRDKIMVGRGLVDDCKRRGTVGMLSDSSRMGTKRGCLG